MGIKQSVFLFWIYFGTWQCVWVKIWMRVSLFPFCKNRLFIQINGWRTDECICYVVETKQSMMLTWFGAVVLFLIVFIPSRAFISCSVSHMLLIQCPVPSCLLCPLPLLVPSGPRSTVHSSMLPNGSNIFLTSVSVCCFPSMPTNSFLSSKEKEITRMGGEESVSENRKPREKNGCGCFHEGGDAGKERGGGGGGGDKREEEVPCHHYMHAGVLRKQQCDEQWQSRVGAGACRASEPPPGSSKRENLPQTNSIWRWLKCLSPCVLSEKLLRLSTSGRDQTSAPACLSPIHYKYMCLLEFCKNTADGWRGKKKPPQENHLLPTWGSSFTRGDSPPLLFCYIYANVTQDRGRTCGLIKKKGV